ncbi:interleukin-7 receptor subunit alpha isoform X2 [Xiphophorus hellerii]|uniref:interleukin-7 receptor subunit alpha isoform X2 n=1 Tax=Xiphophorus hellerii TaxID=8084 RepID=UPI0013B45400|nr:interleukin-7 receptor subunit alpha isoform X2 [Xiphophorus hellerii]
METMLPGWTSVLMLLLLLQAAQSRAQSGDRDPDSEPGLSCSSHVSVWANNLTCQVLGRHGDEDDEDGDRDAIDKMIVCQVRRQNDRTVEKCVRTHGDTVSGLCPVAVANVTVHRRGGGRLSATVLLQKIVKPRSPWIVNVTMDPVMNRAVIYFQIPYRKDYLNLNTQSFQLNLWTDGSNMTQNVSSKNFLQIDRQHLRQDSEYRVRVRSIPVGVLQGTWSAWSPEFSFHTPPEEKPPSPDESERTVSRLVLSSVSVLVVLCCIVVFWKTGIFSYMWPSIPHPKQALVQICKPNKGLLLDLHHEVFSSLRVLPLEKLQAEEAEPRRRPSGTGSAAGSQSGSQSDAGSQSGSGSGSSHSSASSAGTEELEVSALLSCEDGCVPGGAPSPVDVPRPEDESQNLLGRRGGPGQEEAYVTMSSFYQNQ